MTPHRSVHRLGVAAALVDGVIVPGDVEITGSTISAVALTPAPGNLLAVPGFVDLQVNGFAGVDLLHAEDAGYRHVSDALARTGVTAYQPTFVTSTRESTLAALTTLARVRDSHDHRGARTLPAHIEGPFISPLRRGAHDPNHIVAVSIVLADALCDGGPVGMMTVAPELDGAIELARHLHRRGVVVSLGHSDASALAAKTAFDAGARAVTHVLNAMRPISARDPGLAGAALARDDIVVMAIIDNVHLARETVALLRAAAPSRLCLVTDAIEAAGIGDGDFHLGDVSVHVSGAEARLPDGTLAGSVLTMDAAVRNLIAHGASLEEAIDAATRVPAGLLGTTQLGHLNVGHRADVVVLDDAVTVRRTLADGVEVYAA